MLLAILTTPIQVADYRSLFPNTSFTNEGPAEDFLVANNAKKVNLFKEHNKLTEKLQPCNPYEEGEWVYTVEVASLTTEEITAAKESAMNRLRSERDRLLDACDWTQMPDVTLSNKADWATYRQSLRDFPDTVEDARLSYEFPLSPDQKLV